MPAVGGMRYKLVHFYRAETQRALSAEIVGSGCSYFRKTTSTTTALRHVSADRDARGDYISISTITLFTEFHSLPAESVKSSGMPSSPCLGTNSLAWPGLNSPDFFFNLPIDSLCCCHLMRYSISYVSTMIQHVYI